MAAHRSFKVDIYFDCRKKGYVTVHNTCTCIRLKCSYMIQLQSKNLVFYINSFTGKHSTIISVYVPGVESIHCTYFRNFSNYSLIQVLFPHMPE